MRVREGWRGRFFEDFEVGDVYEHPPGRTATAGDARSTTPGSHAEVEPGSHITRRVIEGDSHPCAPDYRLRCRPAARQREAVDASTSHIGFRYVLHGA